MIQRATTLLQRHDAIHLTKYFELFTMNDNLKRNLASASVVKTDTKSHAHNDTLLKGKMCKKCSRKTLALKTKEKESCYVQ
jgi:hypothetical protein